MAAQAGVRSSRELSRRQAYVGFLGGKVFQGGNFQDGDWWDFKSLGQALGFVGFGRFSNQKLRPFIPQ